jgi:O-antigen/teichoic acid export membrane protein
MSAISKRKIAKNLFFLTSSQGATWLMSFAYTIIVPNYLNPDRFGVLAIAFSVSSIIGLICTLGNSTYILKEIARNPEQNRFIVGIAILNNVALGIIAWSGVLLILSFINVSNEISQVMVVYAWASIIYLASTPISAALKGMEKMQYSFLEAIIAKGLLTGLGILFALLNWGVVVIALASLLAAIPATVFNFWIFFRQSSTSFVPRLENIKIVVKGGMAFFVIEVTFQIYLYLDALMLAILTNSEVVGYYRLPTELFGTLLFIPVIVSGAILPALSRLAKEDPDNQIVMTRNTLSLFLCLSFPMAAGATVIAAPFFNLLYRNEYNSSIPIFIILAWTTVPTYIGIGIYQSLVAQDRQGIWSKVTLVSVIVNAVVNIGAIWYFQAFWNNGGIGAAVTLFISEIVTTIIGMFLLAKGSINKQFWMVGLKSLFATGVMTLAIFPLREIFFVIPVIVGVLVYGIMVLVLGIIPRAYIKRLLTLPGSLREKTV